MAREEWWRHSLPSEGRRSPPYLMKWAPDEIIQLARLNPGFGLKNLVKQIYSTKGKLDRNCDVVLSILMEHKEETGEDLYALLQSPDYMIEVDLIDIMAENLRQQRYVSTGIPDDMRLSKKGSKGHNAFKHAVARLRGDILPGAALYRRKGPPQFNPLPQHMYSGGEEE